MKKRMYEKLLLSVLTMSLVFSTGCGSKQEEKKNVFAGGGDKEVNYAESDENEDTGMNASEIGYLEVESKESDEDEDTTDYGPLDVRDYYDEYTWQGAYLDILEANGFMAPESGSYQVDLTNEWTYDLIYVDQDNVPELLMSLNNYYAYVASFQCGKIVITGDYPTGTWGNRTEYVPNKDLLCSMSYTFEGEEEVWYYEYSHLHSQDPLDQDSIKYNAYDWKMITDGGVSTKEEIMDQIKDTFIDINDLKVEKEEKMVVLEPSNEALVIEKFSDGLTYDDLAGYEFEFCSGAGAWSTRFHLKCDGSFWGEYCDDDMGYTGEYNGETYDGERYLCDFTGKFGSLTKVDAFTYKTTITELNFEKTPDTKEIVDGTLVTYTDAYGFKDHKDIYFYLPGKPVKDLDEGFLGWIHIDKESNMDLALNMVCMNNEAQQEGFSGYNEINRTFVWLSFYLDEYDAKYREELNDVTIGPSKKEETATYLYEVWDDYLNDIWNVLLAVKFTEEMNTLKEEERAWILQKEKTMEYVGTSISDATEKEIIMNTVGANITRERCLTLLKLLQDKLD